MRKGGGRPEKTRRVEFAHTDKFKSEGDQRNIVVPGRPGDIIHKGTELHPHGGKTYFTMEETVIPDTGRAIILCSPHKP